MVSISPVMKFRVVDVCQAKYVHHQLWLGILETQVVLMRTLRSSKWQTLVLL